MQTCKIKDVQLENAVKSLATANASLAAAKKQADNAKETIANRLKDLRGIDLSSLKIGDMVNVENILIVEIGKQNRFDAATFQAKNPALYQTFLKDFPTTKYKALV